ncbi:SAF domain-containing protein [uncultured Bifidobacterium sp.]|uniref:SAF domain-containing protein n=1 Tax=uncultured Bifidobacterium sp. TaxID=165187 RepID=UPI00262BB8E8|nr:SAF domain-containing protein [uncultured Bifidobacterium sp.]
MVTFFHIPWLFQRPLSRQSLARRRRLRAIRRALSAVGVPLLLIGLATALVDGTTTTVIVAARAISAGRVLSEKDLDARSVPKNSSLGGVFSDAGALVNRVITVDANPGDVLSRSMITSAAAPSHYSTIEVPVIGEPQGNPIGRHVSLATDGECDGSERTTDGLCVISSDSVILSAPRDVNGTTTLSCAMSGSDALRVSRAVRESPLVIVMSAD